MRYFAIKNRDKYPAAAPMGQDFLMLSASGVTSAIKRSKVEVL